MASYGRDILAREFKAGDRVKLIVDSYDDRCHKGDVGTVTSTVSLCTMVDWDRSGRAFGPYTTSLRYHSIAHLEDHLKDKDVL